ncbi:Efflux pump vrtL [Lachnellula suecica]|uniref:Efflux pump vrtL n=1 Tax=Lachnellula suecica TaxID=602035 RepID=A0A8T9CBK0_9HELO|nr:Efflux pump vrtL [Lachnellula suecica]
MIAFGFLSRFGSGASLAVGGEILSDCFSAKTQGRAGAVYKLFPLRGMLFMRETHAPTILARRLKIQIQTAGNTALHTPYSSADEKTIWTIIGLALRRPLRMLTTQPIIFCLFFYYAYTYGIMYLVLSTFSTLWETVYNEFTSIAGLNYISLGLGYFVGSQICAISVDRIYNHLKIRRRHFRKSNTSSEENTAGLPEYRLPLMAPASLFIPAGLLIYGLTAAAHSHWIFPVTGTFLFGLGAIISFQCIQNYLIDAYSLYTASAIGATTFLRAIGGFGLPLLGPKLYESLGYGGGNGLLAGTALVVGCTAPFVLWRWGPVLKARSKFAAGE